MLRSCTDALLRVAAQTGPLQTAPAGAREADPQAGPSAADPPVASSSADQDPTPATQSRQHGEEASSIEAQASSAAEEAGLDAESAAPAAPQPQDVPTDSGAAAPIAGAESLAASDLEASLSRSPS